MTIFPPKKHSPKDAMTDFTPRLASIAIFCQLIHPCGIKLWAAQLIRLIAVITQGNSAIRPCNPDRLVANGGQFIWRADRKQPRHHNLFQILLCLGYNCNAGRAVLDLLSNPLCSGFGFPKPAPSQDQPRVPVTIFRYLVRSRPKWPMPFESRSGFNGELRYLRFPLRFWQRGQ